jgi:hypothetical protein
VNTLHAVLRLLADPDEELKARVVMLVTNAIRLQHKQDIHDVRSVDGVRSYYISMADWGFMPEIVGTLAALDDLKGMARAGMTASFPPSLKSMALTDMKACVVLVLLFWRSAQELVS